MRTDCALAAKGISKLTKHTGVLSATVAGLTSAAQAR